MASIFDDRQVLVFVSVIAAAIVLAGSVFVLNLINPILFVIGLLVFALLVFLFPRFVEFKEYERGVLFRTGRLHGVIGPGWVWIIPLIDKYTLVDLRTQAVVIPGQKVISQDGVVMNITASINYKVIDPAKYITSARNISQLLNLSAIASLRDTSSKLSYTEVILHTDKLAAALKAAIDAESDTWGIDVTVADIKDVVLPKDLLDAMRLKEEAEQRKDAIETQASIKQIYLKALDDTASKLSPQTLSYLYLDALRKMVLGKSAKVIVPVDFAKVAPESLMRSMLTAGDKEKTA
ncbi:MAG: SPFH domain-containing protein [Candidatus Micrarchaeia archaeon]